MPAGRYLLVYPMFAMVLVTATVLITLFRRRVHAVKERLITTAYYRVYQDQGVPEPEGAAKAARHFSNLFEAPTLFYVACLAAMITDTGGVLMVILAWCYVAARVAHAGIHLGPNKLRWRIRAYFASWLILMAMWVQLVVGVAACQPSCSRALATLRSVTFGSSMGLDITPLRFIQTRS